MKKRTTLKDTSDEISGGPSAWHQFQSLYNKEISELVVALKLTPTYGIKGGNVELTCNL